MADIKIEKNPSESKLHKMGVFSWPVWEKELSEFPWFYDEKETCYFLSGEVEVQPSGGKPVRIGKGDLGTFPKGMRCTGIVRRDVRKHYKFGD
jgi:uncharacterized protein